MTQLNLVDSFKEFKEFKNIDREVMMGILEDVFRAMILKKYGDDSNFDIIINPEKDLEIWRNRTIVADGAVEDENEEIALSEALKIEDDFEEGEEVSEEIKLESFGRRNVLSLRQNLAGRIMDLEKDAIYQKYKERVGEVVSAEVYQIWKREILLVDDEDNEVVMPRENQIPGDFFKKGDTIRAVVHGGNEEQQPAHRVVANGPRILGALVRAGSARDLRRLDHHQARSTCPG